jgi:hypothetical protein
VFGEFAGEDREEHDVVDAQYDFQDSERRQSSQSIERQQFVHKIHL